jgi:hypothetical protein
MVPSLRALLDGILDYAGLFPPARLPLEEAVRNYLRYRREPESWMLARFVCPAVQLLELGALLKEIGQGEAPVPLAVLGRGGATFPEFRESVHEDLKAIQDFRRRFGGQATVEVLELRWPQKPRSERPDVLALVERQNSAAFEQAAGQLVTFSEFPAGGWHERNGIMFASLWRDPGLTGFKFRCGSVQPEAFPPVERLAAVIVGCSEDELPLKFTAGLHHPIRRFDPGLRVTMHGFINVFGAAVLAHTRDLYEEQIQPILKDEDAHDFVFDDAGFRWKDYRVSTEEITAARRWVVSFGSCSFEEPVHDLRALGWLI